MASLPLLTTTCVAGLTFCEKLKYCDKKKHCLFPSFRSSLQIERLVSMETVHLRFRLPPFSFQIPLVIIQQIKSSIPGTGLGATDKFLAQEPSKGVVKPTVN